MSCHFTKQVLVQLDFLRLWKGNEASKTDVCLLPGQLEKKVARIHRPSLGAVLTFFAEEHADYIAVQIASRLKATVFEQRWCADTAMLAKFHTLALSWFLALASLLPNVSRSLTG